MPARTKLDPVALPANREQCQHPNKDIETLGWAAEYLHLSRNTAYALARAGQLPGAHKWGSQWRISVPAFLKAVRGGDPSEGVA